MRTNLKEVSGIDWFDGAVMNCEWIGPKLRDVLIAAGLNDSGETENDSFHVQFACHAVPQQDADYYGASIPLGRAMNEDADVILAMEVYLAEVKIEEHYANTRCLDEWQTPHCKTWLSSSRRSSWYRWCKVSKVARPDHHLGTRISKPLHATRL